MSNYKIRVNGEAESKEVQGLFVVLGYMVVNNIDCEKGYIVASKNAESPINFDYWHDVKNIITIQQLRDLVILKRNDVGDATHEDYLGLKHLLLKNTRHAWGGDKWLTSSADFSKLKPIEKTEMKEYLRKNSNGTYSYIGPVHTDHVHDLMIEIPEGSETFNYYDRKDNLFFLKGSGEDTMFSNDLNDWDWKHWGNIDFDGVVCLWSRHTHPEELPFIDDEPSLNDQYAEIETVRQTLNQRQEQYGSFEDVAMITEQMVGVMRKGYYENLAYNQKMALYMICSKMARIVNGNPNHKDSWHDIAGYATLIDSELVSEKDMPF